MKSRETKAQDLAALTESLQNSKSAMVISFTGLTVTKDQEFRNSVREAGAKYQVVKNTLARIAVKGTDFEQAADAFKGVTAIAWTEDDPVVLTKAISKFMKDNSDIYTFKTGVVDGSLVDFAQLQTIASLPSKEELISKLLYVLNAQAQRIVTVISAVPRDLAVVIKQIGEQKPADSSATADDAASAEPAAEDAAPAAEAELAPADESAPKVQAADDGSAEAVAEPEAEAAEVSTEALEEAAAAAPDDVAEEILGATPEVETEEKAE